MNKSPFKIIQGGFDPAAEPARRVFLSAEATDTRLMGVSALAITWTIYPYKDSDDGAYHFHQFFYYDAEEYGFDSYRSMAGDDTQALEMMQKAMIGGLGGKNISLSQREATALVQFYASGSKRLHVPLPEPSAEYAFLLRTPLQLTAEEQNGLWRKICTPLRSPEHLIHYYLMRLMSRDRDACAFLTAAETDPDALFDRLTQSHPAPMTFCKNTVEEHQDPDGIPTFLCESVLEDDNGYLLAIFELRLQQKDDPNETRVSSCVLQSIFRISSVEAAMQLCRRQWVTCYDILLEPESFDTLFNLFSIGFMLNAHEAGRLFMEFNEHNDHVNQKVFKLNEDIHGLYYVSDYGQLIVAAYSQAAIADVELRLKYSPLGEFLKNKHTYDFHDEALYDFIDSGYDDFNAYAETDPLE